MLLATAACNFSTSEPQKVLRGLQFFNILTSECAFRHSRVQFRHQNFRKCSENNSFSPFWLPNVCFATAACIFSTSELQKVLRGLQFFNILSSECAFRHSRVQFRHQNFKKCSENNSFSPFWLPNVRFATAACIFSTSELQKVLREWQFFNILTSECASRHSGVQFFDMRTSKSAPKLMCFVQFDFSMRFSPQWRAIFRHLNFQKCSETVSFFSSFTSKCAFRHSGVQFLISPLSSYLRTRRFNRPTFGLTRHTNHWKNTAFRDFSNIWRGCIFFLLTFALLHLLSADLTTLLCFSTVHIVGSFYLNFLRQILKTYIHTIHIHSYTYIYNFFHHHHHHPPPPTPQGGRGTGALLCRPITMGWGGGYLAMLAHIYIHTFKRRGIPFLHGWHWAWPRFFNPWLASLGISPHEGQSEFNTRVRCRSFSSRFCNVCGRCTYTKVGVATARDGNAGCFWHWTMGSEKLPVDSVGQRKGWESLVDQLTMGRNAKKQHWIFLMTSVTSFLKKHITSLIKSPPSCATLL